LTSKASVAAERRKSPAYVIIPLLPPVLYSRVTI
jgi:hypothetical protein